MTLVKVKPKRPTTGSRRRVGQHHRHGRHYLKAYWPYLPIISILTLGLFANSWLGQAHRNVLGYATDMSVQSLLDDTNSQRSSNSETSLHLNSALGSAAQAKASDMAARDYWSHDTPDGKTPWSFMTAAGYNYQTAGENLAYGFATAGDTITGWMNSPEHRANILNSSFHDVGFGIVNIADYQGTGPETLVVAMYGSLASAPVAAATPSQPPAIITHVVPAPKPQPAPAPAPPQQAAPIATPVPADTPATPTTSKGDTLEPSPQRVTQFQLVASNVPVSATAVSLLGLAAFAFIVLRHSLAWRKVLIHGETFVLHHPLFDVSAVSIASLAVVLSHTAGLIR